MTILSFSPKRVILLFFILASCQALQLLPTTRSTDNLSFSRPSRNDDMGRRSFVTGLASVVTASLVLLPGQAAHADLQFSTSASGIQWADAKLGSGSPKVVGDVTAVDYVLSTTGARYGTKIYSTQGSTSSAVPAAACYTTVPGATAR